MLFINLIKSAKFEILLILPTVNAFLREYRIGAMQLLKELSMDRSQELIEKDEENEVKGKKQEKKWLVLRF